MDNSVLNSKSVYSFDENNNLMEIQIYYKDEYLFTRKYIYDKEGYVCGFESYKY